MDEPQPIAKIIWHEAESGQVMEYILMEGATATIGRSRANDICVPERHVSRRHAVVRYQDGVFVVEDLGSANGTFVNDAQISAPYPVMAGDIIRLFVPELRVASCAERPSPNLTSSMIISPSRIWDRPYVVVTAGEQEGAEFRFLKSTLVLGRATANAAWDICLEDRAVSRPHCRFERLEDGSGWAVADLRSANGTRLNGQIIPPEEVRPLNDGDVLGIGATTLLYRTE